MSKSLINTILVLSVTLSLLAGKSLWSMNFSENRIETEEFSKPGSRRSTEMQNKPGKKELFSKKNRESHSYGSTFLLQFILVTAATSGIYQYDARIRKYISSKKSKKSSNLAMGAELFGNGYFFAPALGAFYLLGAFFNNKKAKSSALYAFESFFLAGILTLAIKVSTQRHRPETGDPFNTWDGPKFSGRHLSFPSGHTSSIFAITASISNSYKKNILLSFLFYSIAVTTAFSRVHDEKHWSSDVFFGAAIGYWSVTLVSYLNKKMLTKKIYLSPLIGPQNFGAQVFLSFF